MEKYLSIGGKLFHKYLGFVVVKQVDNQKLLANAGSLGVLPFGFYDFGKVLFLYKEHATKSFNTYDEYITFCEEERIKKIEEVEREKEIELERIKKLLKIKQESAELKIKVEREKEIELKHHKEVEKDLKTKLIEDLKQQHQFEGFHHYTDLTNFFRIMKNEKLFSRNKAIELGFTDSASQEVLSHTHKYIMDFVRFFYKEKTPTIYKNEGIKVDNEAPHMPIPVLIIFDESIIYHSEVAFLSGGGGNPHSICTKSINQASKFFDWYVIFSRGPIPRFQNNIQSVGNDTSGASITNKRNAEFLYPTEIDIKYINKIIFRSPADKKTAEIILGKNNLFLIDNNQVKFNYIHGFLYDYEIISQGKDFLITLIFYRGFGEYTHELYVYYHDKTIEKIDIDKLSKSRRTDMEKPKEFDDFDYFFVLKVLKNKRATRIEYLMNGHLSAIWEE